MKDWESTRAKEWGLESVPCEMAKMQASELKMAKTLP